MRAALGFRQSDVAARVHISQGRYSLLERGELAPTDEEVRTIEEVLTLPNDTAQALLTMLGNESD
jgi:transcriptional regulator with XRE-family HTH domain